jgi:dinuclear metal center YbgI/SA1388 family protein
VVTGSVAAPARPGAVAARFRRSVASPAVAVTVAEVVSALAERYPPDWAAGWDAVGLTCGDPAAPVRTVLLAVDPVGATVDEALDAGAGLLVTHHPLLLRGVHSVAADTAKGRLVHRLVTGGCALYTAHTNADVADPGVSDALARRIGLVDLRVLAPAEGDGGTGYGRVGRLASPLRLAELTAAVADALPPTAAGVRAAGDPDRVVATVAVCGGAGDAFLADAARAGADAFLTADLRHHPASEHLEAGGPALLDAAHWATERPWLDDLASHLTDLLGGTVQVLVSDAVTDPWTVHASSDHLRADHLRTERA